MVPLTVTLAPWQFLTVLVIAVALGGWVTVLRLQGQRLMEAKAALESEREAVLQFLRRMGELITGGTDLESTLEIITEFLIEETGAEAGAIFLLEEERGAEVFRARAVHGLFPPLRPATGYVLTKQKYLHDKIRADRIPRDETILGHVATRGEGLLVPDARAESRIPPEAHDLVPLESMMLMPLRVRDRLVGIFAVVNKHAAGKTFDAEDMSLLRALADQAAVTVNIVRLYSELTEKQRIESELRIAQDFQNLLLPREMPSVEGFEIDAICTPALEMGGDHFDFIRIDDDHLGIVIADVSGKGMPAALIMAAVRSALRSEARGKMSPREVLRTVNRHVCEDTRANVFITMTYAILDERTQRLRFARAGHEPLITCPTGDGQPVLHSPEGMALGLVAGETFDVTEDMTIDLSTTELAVLYTDGVVEAMDETRQEYGQERLFNILQRHATADASAVIGAVLDDIQEFTGGFPQSDDITLVALRRRGEAKAVSAPRAEGQIG